MDALGAVGRDGFQLYEAGDWPSQPFAWFLSLFSLLHHVVDILLGLTTANNYIRDYRQTSLFAIKPPFSGKKRELHTLLAVHP